MANPKIKVRGAARSKGIPQGYVLGRSSKGNGDVELLSLGGLRAMGVASRQDVASLALAFIQLTDVPQSYAASGLKTLRVNAGATGLEFVTQNAISSTTLTVTGAGTAAVTIDMPASGATAGSYTNASITVDAQGRVTAAASGAASASYLPLVNGDAAPLLLFGNGQTIGVLISPAKVDTRMLAYLATDTLANRPATPNVCAGSAPCYLANDTGKFYVWSGSSWVSTN